MQPGSDLLDIAVLGGGEAGAAAAIGAAQCGAKVAVLDDRAATGDDGLSAALAAGATVYGSCDVWGVGGGNLVSTGTPQQHFRLDAVCDGRSFSVAARALILCPGAYESVIPFGRNSMVPAIAAAGIFRADMEFAPTRGGWVPCLDEAQRSSAKLLYVAGDAGGIAPPGAAPITGRIAALAAVSDLGLLEAALAETQIAALRRELAGLPALSAADQTMMPAIPAECVVCPCEGVTRAQIDGAVAAGARDLNQLKQFTRIGMGPCQGRICGEAAAELMAQARGGRVAVGIFTPRIPLRPVPMTAVLGAFDYADIPVPAPAPI